jgi:hypothetical protein
MVDRGGVQGAVTFALPDGTPLNCALSIDGQVVGPSDAGPVTVSVDGSNATLTNRTRTPMHVADLVAVDPSGAAAVVAVDTTLAPGASDVKPVPAGTKAAVADAVAAVHQSIEELDVFVDDLALRVLFVNQVTLANHDLTGLAVSARLKDLDHIETVDLPQDGTASVTFTLPLTDYLGHRTLQYALVEKTKTASTTTAWRDWNLKDGVVIGVTADQL